MRFTTRPAEESADSLEIEMGKRGPSKGHGGRPRTPKSNVTGAYGYKRVSVGAPSKGKRVSEHRAKAGLANTKGTGSGESTIVHHKDGNKANNSRSNLQKMKRKQHPKQH